MKKIFIYTLPVGILSGLLSVLLLGCEKHEKGFLSPYFQYAIKEYTVSKGRSFTSDAINPDGSSQPFNSKILHVYDSAGTNVDEIFFKTYDVPVWSSSFNVNTDTTVESILAKRTVQQIPAIRMNERNGAIEANQASVNLPDGVFSFDIEVTNEIGTKTFEKLVRINIVDDGPFETIPALGTVYNRVSAVGDEVNFSDIGVPELSIEKVSDEPSQIVFKIIDKNGVPFNPANGEIVIRPNTGLNPVTPYLQHFEQYTHAYTPTDTAMVFPFASTPMPQESVGNGYNMYYRIPAEFVTVDGREDEVLNCNPRLPLRVWQPGTYNVTMQLPDVTHK